MLTALATGLPRVVSMMQLRPVGFVSADASLVMRAVPPAEVDVAIEVTAEVIPAPSSFVGESLFAMKRRAAAHVIAAISQRVGRMGVAGNAALVAGNPIAARRGRA